MSIDINNPIKYCYIVNMIQGELAAWLERKYLEWQLKNGRGNIDIFANFLEISQPYLSLLMSGKRKILGMKKAMQIAEKTNDYSILDILGYARPDPRPVPFSSLPPEFLELLKSIDGEIRNTLIDRGITEYSPAAVSVASEILEKYGAKLISTTKSGKSTN